MKFVHKTVLTLVVFLTFIVLQTFSQPLQKQWDRVYGGLSFEYLSTFIKLSDGNYLLAGYSLSNIGGDKTQNSLGLFDYWIVKIDTAGTIIWDKTIGGSADDNLIKAIETTDGGFLLGGISNSDPGFDKTDSARAFSYDYWIVKTDGSGNVQWDKTFGTEFDDSFIDLTEYNGSYILGGYTGAGISFDKTEPSRGNADYWIIKTDLQGNKLWDKTLGGTSYDRLAAITPAGDGNILIGGYSQSSLGADKSQTTRGMLDYWTVKINSAGNKLWDKTFGSNRDEYLFQLVNHNNCYYWFGVSNSDVMFDKTIPYRGGSVNVDYWILQTDTNGNKINETVFGGFLDDNDITSVQITQDNGWLIGGTSYSYPSGDKTEANLGTENMWAIKTDSMFNKQWDKTILTDMHEEQNLAIEQEDGVYLFANTSLANTVGDKSAVNWGQNDYWLSKWNVVVGLQSFAHGNNFNVYYDYVNEKIIVKNNSKKPIRFTLYNAMGAEITNTIINSSNSVVELPALSQNGLIISQGVYFATFQSQKQVITKKILLK